MKKVFRNVQNLLFINDALFNAFKILLCETQKIPNENIIVSCCTYQFRYHVTDIQYHTEIISVSFLQARFSCVSMSF